MLREENSRSVLFGGTMMKKHILERLSSQCHFEEMFEGKPGSLREPDRKIGHVRADYDG